MTTTTSRSAIAIVVRTACLAAAVGLNACATVPPNVPVRGTPDAIAQLVGSWEGVYSSEQTGRSGIIQFALRAGKDTAQGDVVMLHDDAVTAPTFRPMTPFGTRCRQPRC